MRLESVTEIRGRTDEGLDGGTVAVSERRTGLRSAGQDREEEGCA